MSLRFEKIADSNFKDFRALMCTGDISGQCFCLNHRVEPKDLELEEVAAAKMQQLVGRRKVHGLLGFEDGVPVAWVGVEPFPSLVGHDVFEMILNGDDFGPYGEESWGIHCLFVRESHRGRGVSSVLVKEAVNYAVDRGAERLLAFPPPEERAMNMHITEKFSGTVGLYIEHGFHNKGQLSPSYLLYELTQFPKAPRLSLV